MQAFIFLLLCIPLLSAGASGRSFRNFLRETNPLESYDVPYSSKEAQNDTLTPSSESFDINNDGSGYRSEQKTLNSSGLYTNENSSQTDQLMSSDTIINSSQSPVYSTDNVPNRFNTHEEATLTEIFSSESNSPSSVQQSSSSSSSTTLGGKSSIMTTNSVIPTYKVNGSSTTEDDETEGVARGKPTSTEGVLNTTEPQPKTLYQRTLELINDTYTLSIVVPIAAGVVFASTIIVTIATCKCLRRRCRRRRLHRKSLPECVKNLRPSDRARLLAESSDEEF